MGIIDENTVSVYTQMAFHEKVETTMYISCNANTVSRIHMLTFQNFPECTIAEVPKLRFDCASFKTWPKYCLPKDWYSGDEVLEILKVSNLS